VFATSAAERPPPDRQAHRDGTTLARVDPPAEILKRVHAAHSNSTRPREQGRFDCHRAAERVPGEDRVPHALAIDRGQNIVGELDDPPFLPVPAGFSVPGQIESDLSETIRERAMLAVPERPVGKPAVNRDNSGIRRAGYRVRYSNAVS
jgi:hypothetical protein